QATSAERGVHEVVVHERGEVEQFQPGPGGDLRGGERVAPEAPPARGEETRPQPFAPLQQWLGDVEEVGDLAADGGELLPVGPELNVQAVGDGGTQRDQ